MEPTGVDVDELIEFWTLLDEDRPLLAGKRGGTALGFAVLLLYFQAPGGQVFRLVGKHEDLSDYEGSGTN